MIGSKNLKTRDSYTILKRNTIVSLKSSNKLLTVVNQHVIECVQNVFLDQSPYYWWFDGCLTKLQSDGAEQ